MRRVVAAFLIAFMALAVESADADAILVTGADLVSSRSTANAGQITGLSAWSGSGNNGFEISWNIVFNAGTNDWTYTYTLSGEGGSNLSKGLSHFILQLSDNVDWSNQDFGNDFDEVRSTGTGTGAGNPANTFSQNDGNSNPTMPGAIPGVKFDGGGSEAPVTFTFTTDHAPIWGNFYAIDGKNTTPETSAYNTGFTGDYAMPTAATLMKDQWIATPDTVSGGPGGTPGGVPEPGLLLMLGMGAAVVAWRKRR